MSHSDQTLSRVASAALPPAALCHRYASVSPSSPIHPNVGVYIHAQNLYPSNEEYHPPKSNQYLYTSWDGELQPPGDLHMKITHQ